MILALADCEGVISLDLKELDTRDSLVFDDNWAKDSGDAATPQTHDVIYCCSG